MEDQTVAKASEPVAANDKATTARLSVQLKRLNEANGKYKSLLKLAKERIQQQEEELETLRHETAELQSQLQQINEERSSEVAALDTNSERGGTLDDGNTTIDIFRVLQRVKVPIAATGQDEFWALIELESYSDTDNTSKRFKEWKRFDTEAELSDYIRRDSGEPLTLPPYSLSPEQSARLQSQTQSQISSATEEFRRFRVRSELARKQLDAQIRDLQNNHVQSATRRIEGNTVSQSNGILDTMPSHHQNDRSSVQHLKAELAAQEAHWKDAYEALASENEALKSVGSEALLAAQWRQRYEHVLKEKEDLQSKLQTEAVRVDEESGDKYERKYRDLKESFRLYRKKAKEIFESQQRGAGTSTSILPSFAPDSSSADAKLSYLRNLMVNYLTSDPQVKDHMEGAIGTVLQFTPEEISKIDKKKADLEAWF
jgi:chromosome segregation ATPase